ncbi:MAG TPA: hemerythrin domain-containing protein [Rectinemataceae bacterium]|nr:hemerythrin domain-containing protein [Rectinemataceae bacterium]
MKVIEAGLGVQLVEVPESGLSILCGCPENVYKLLRRAGAISRVEGGGEVWESGPNAILLSEFPIQGGRFCNLIEFPVLQMLYRQGMMLPGHPNNHGLRPLLIGHRDDLEAMARYVRLGNYGLSSVDALVAAGLGREEAGELLRMKRHFAFGSFKATEELLEFRTIEGPAVELRGGTYLRRLGPNRYQFFHGDDSALVDLSLPPGKVYGLPYVLPRASVSRELFSVVHIGEGTGWDVERPCMGSLVVYRGEFWLIDAGPHVRESLAALGLGVDDLRGVFITHAHDDHVVGLTALLHAERRIQFLAVPWVRATVREKLHALAGLDEEAFRQTFELRDLVEGVWNDLEGLEVRPFLSPHPVETTCLRFRVRGPAGERSYAHLADLSSFEVIDAMVRESDRDARGEELPGITRAFAERTKALYLEPADLKKVDVGGGMIHGEARDFASDTSGELLLSHTDSAADIEAALGGRAALGGGGAPGEIRGRVAVFGEESLLIAADRDYRREAARALLEAQFADVPGTELDALLVAAPRAMVEGERFMARGELPDSVELILSGLVADERGALYGAGWLVGEAECLAGLPPNSEFRCATGVESLPIPGRLFADFVDRLELGADRALRREIVGFLRNCELFPDIVATASIDRLASRVVLVSYSAGEACGGGGGDVHVLVSGRVALRAGGAEVATLGPREIFGEEAVFSPGAVTFDMRALEEVTAYLLPLDELRKIPYLLWRLREILARRLAAARRSFDYLWRPEYSVGVPELDAQHRGLFALLDALVAEINDPGACGDIGPSIEALRPVVVEHFRTEEALMEKADYEGLAFQRERHAAFLLELDEWARRVACGDRHAARDLGDFLADWLIRHTLGIDRAYAGRLGELGAGADLVNPRRASNI